MFLFELEMLALLEQTNGWDTEIRDTCRESSYERAFDPAAPTAREQDVSSPILSRVVDGDVVLARLPWLAALYCGAFRDIAERATSRKILTSPSRISAININIVSGQGARYERHVDTNHLTGLLFANDLKATDGGRLVLDDSTRCVKILPKRGNLLLFDGRNAAHHVEPLTRDINRTTVVMNYYYADEAMTRPADLDQYLYKKAGRPKDAGFV
jgi:hypothetical protein